MNRRTFLKSVSVAVVSLAVGLGLVKKAKETQELVFRADPAQGRDTCCSQLFGVDGQGVCHLIGNRFVGYADDDHRIHQFLYNEYMTYLQVNG